MIFVAENANDIGTPRLPGAVGAGVLYDVSNRGDGRGAIFHMPLDCSDLNEFQRKGCETGLAAIQSSAQKGGYYGSPEWIEQTAARLRLKSTPRNRGRPQVPFPHPRDQGGKNES